MDYIPRNDAGTRVWLNNFAEVIQRDPGAVGVAADDAVMLATLAENLDRAIDIAQNPVTRTMNTVAAKDAAREEAVRTFRKFATQIKANPNISVEVKMALGLNVKESRSTPRIAQPCTAPIIQFMAARPEGREVVYIMRYADQMTPESRAKPPGVMQLQLHAIFNELVSSEPAEFDSNRLVLVGAFTTTPFRLTFGPEHNNKLATFYGRWATRTGLTGPWSQPEVLAISSL